jgi:hypothetical protein
MAIVTHLSFTSPRLWGEVAARSLCERAAGEGAPPPPPPPPPPFLPARTVRQFPLTRLASSMLATLSPQAGRGKRSNG